jgi:O-acetyl-ADP-ribose deacetylase (regulator of RNase III)
VIKYKKGDLIKAALSGEVDVIMHQCNCFNTMGSGIAPKIAKAFPGAYAIDQSTEKGDEGKLGTYTVSHENPVCSVVNLYGQYGFWKQEGGKINTDYCALAASLEAVGDKLRKYKPNAKIGLPKLGCGLGGGDWIIVEELIQRKLYSLDVTVYEL